MLQFQKPKNIGSLTSILLVLIKQARYRAGVAEHVLEDGHVRELYILCFEVK